MLRLTPTKARCESTEVISLPRGGSHANQESTSKKDKTRVYVGTNTGQVFYSRDAGDTWDPLADFLPPVLSVETAIVE